LTALDFSEENEKMYSIGVTHSQIEIHKIKYLNPSLAKLLNCQTAFKWREDKDQNSS